MINVLTQDDETALYNAVFQGHVEIVKLLLKWKAEFNICDKVYIVQ